MADNKDIVRRAGGYSGDESGSYVFFDSRNSKYGPAQQQDLGTSVSADKAASVLNQLNQNSSIVTQDLGVWRGVTPGYRANTHGQQSIEGLMSLKNMSENSDLIVYDTEILGTAPHQRLDKHNLDFYTPTEIGFQHVKMVNGELQSTGNSLSMLMKPNKEVYGRLDSLISDISNGKWAGMTDDVRRTLSDLTLYAGDPGQLFKEVKKDGRRIVTVNGQSRNLHPLKGSVLTSSENISLMKKGLRNLMDWGTTPEDAILEMNSFMRTMQNVRFAGYNVYNFDQPMMLDWLNSQVGKHTAGSKVNTALGKLKKDMALNQIDGLHAVRSLYRNLYSQYGDSTTLERMKDIFNLGGSGQAHHALSDVKVTVEQINRLLKDVGIAESITNGGKGSSGIASFNTKTIKAGDRLFGSLGMSSKKAGEFDGVYRMRKGKLHSAYDMKSNPVYRNSSYRVDKFFDGIRIDGKNMYGVQLYNETDDLYHTIFRSSHSELQNAIHGHLDYVGRAIDKKGVATKIPEKYLNAHNIQNEDRGLRRWRKMFSTEGGGGMGLAERMYGALDMSRAIEEDTAKFTSKEGYMAKGMSEADAIRKVARNEARVANMKKSAILGQNAFNTDEFVRDFGTIRGRLEGEEEWIRGFINRVKTSSIGGEGNGKRRVQNLAFSEFGKLMDESLGANIGKQLLPNGQKALQLTMDGEASYLTINNADSMRGSLYGHLYKGHVGRPNLGVLKTRYRELLTQLKAYNALDAKKFEEMYKAFDSVTPTSSIDNMLNDIAQAVIRAKETNSLNGALRKIDIENPTKVEPSRLKELRKQKSKLFGSLASQAINGVSPFESKWDGNLIQINDKKALEILEEHDSAIQSILKRNSIDSSIAIDTKNIKSSRSSLTQLAESFTKQDLNVQFRYDGKRKGLIMVLADKSVSESVLDGSTAHLRPGGKYANQVAVIDLPRIMKDGTISLGGQNRVARLKATKLGGQDYQFLTGFDEILKVLGNSAKSVKNQLKSGKDLGEKGTIIAVGDYLNRKAKKTMQNLSMNNRYGNPADAENLFQVRSLAANLIRGGAIDISDVAEDWYTSWHMNQSEERKKLLRLKTPDEVREIARRDKDIFANSMGIHARRVFQREADDFVKMKTGLELGMHSVKDTHVSNFLRSNIDARGLLPFGYYNPMARENIMKTVNYLSLDKSNVESNLARQLDRNGNRVYSDADIARMTQRGVVTNSAATLLEEAGDEGRLSYLNMRAAYMDDKYIAKRMTELAADYQERSQSAATQAERDKYASFAGRLKNLENISTYDGMILMSEESSKAFITTREKKIKLAPGAELTEDIKKLFINAYREDEHGKKPTIDWSKDISIKDWRADANGLIKDPKLLTNLGGYVDTFHSYQNNGGKLTISEIVKKDLDRDELNNLIPDGNGGYQTKVSKRVDQVYSSWNAGHTRIKGWNAEERSLILEEVVHNMNGMKVITEGGHRATTTLLPEEVLGDLSKTKSGQKVNMILPSFESSKAMWGTELSKFVALAVDEAKAQIDGSHGGRLSKQVTAGKIGKQEALEVINRIMQTSFGIKDKALSKVLDGQIVLDDLIGAKKGKEMSYTFENLNKFMTGIDKYLGTDFATGDGKTAFGNIGVGRQDIYDWENGIGLTDEGRGGLVRYGRKELDMISARANEVLKTRSSAVVGWLGEHIEATAKAQNNNIEQIGAGLIRTVVGENGNKLKADDVIIKTAGQAFSSEDPAGALVGRIGKNGTREISMNAFNPLPKVTAAGVKPIADEYAQTIVDFARVKGGFSDGVSFEEAIKKNRGTALLEMPDNSFASKYIRLVDFGDVTKGGIGDTPLLRELQKIQQQIWRGTQEYQAVGKSSGPDAERVDEIRGRVNELIGNYEDKAARMVTSARDDGLMKTFGAAKMDMSGRFRVQGVNPFENYEQVGAEWKQKAKGIRQYEEGSIYVSRDRMREMITDTHGRATAATENIAEAMGISIKGLQGDDITKLVLDNINDKGLYGFVNRYPTIKQSTIQAMRFRIDDTITDSGPIDRTARLTVGTAQRLKADYDGDFLSGVLAHYGATKSDALSIHKDLKAMNAEEVIEAQAEGAKVLSGLEKDLANPMKQMNLTVGGLAQEYNEAQRIAKDQWNERQRKIVGMWDSAINTRLNPSDAIETREARLGKEFVGFIDNTRDKVLNLATSTIEVLENNNKIGKDTAIAYRKEIEEFSAVFSQELISSKKLNIGDEIIRQTEIARGIGTDFTSQAGREEIERKARESINERYLKIQEMNEAVLNPTRENMDLFKQHNEEIQLFKTTGADAEKNIAKMDNALNRIHDVARWNSVSGSYRNTSLLMGVSEGRDAEVARRFLSGQGAMVVRTQATERLAKIADDEVGSNLLAKMDNWEKSVLYGYDKAESGGKALVDTLGANSFNIADHSLSGATVAEEQGGKLRETLGKFVPKVVNSGGFGGGAIAFGAMWAASALIRSGPTPEGLQEQMAPPPVPTQQMQTPTARVTQNNGEYVNIRVSAKNAKNMSEQDIAALVHQEIGSMTTMKMNTTLNVNDNTQNIDQQWIQGVVANAIDKGIGF